MAKFDSIIKFTGNLDGMVGMKGAKGQTYIRKNVKPVDPKTKAQVETRTKLSLAGQISKLTPSSAIVGLAGGKRERRNRFMKLMLKNMGITDSNDFMNKVAILPPEKLIFSEGREFPINAQISAAAGPARGVVVKVDAAEGNRIKQAGIESVIVIFVWSEDDIYRNIDVKSVVIDNLSTQGVTSLNLFEKCNVYIIPVLPVDGGARADYLEGVERMEDEGYSVAAQLIAQNAITLGQSAFNGVGTVNQG